MAEKRMFAKSIIDSDQFLDMPTTAQLLYFHLCMRGDDDGFINNPKSIMRNVRCTDDDMRILIAKQYVIPFESGIVVIKHWKIHNYIQKDRYRPSNFEEKQQILVDEKTKEYKLDTECIQPVSIDKNRIDKNRIDIGGKAPRGTKKTFVPPTKADILAYVAEKVEAGKTEYKNVDVNTFFDYYNEADWHMSNGKKVKSWKQCLITWVSREWNKKQEQPKKEEVKRPVYADEIFTEEEMQIW